MNLKNLLHSILHTYFCSKLVMHKILIHKNFSKTTFHDVTSENLNYTNFKALKNNTAISHKVSKVVSHHHHQHVVCLQALKQAPADSERSSETIHSYHIKLSAAERQRDEALVKLDSLQAANQRLEATYVWYCVITNYHSHICKWNTVDVWPVILTVGSFVKLMLRSKAWYYQE